MHNLNSYVRDFYFFHRNIYPQLSLVYMNPDAAFQSLQKQVRVATIIAFQITIYETYFLIFIYKHDLHTDTCLLSICINVPEYRLVNSAKLIIKS